METQLRLIEAKLLRNTRNRRFRTIVVDPADRLAQIGQRGCQSDFAMTVQVMRPSTEQATEQSHDGSMEFWSQ
ncbi:hypothetical protein LOC68_00780 [Blastopirellula sp. JC732]|uniref:Uncharacterized protein n=1 Tax=Blastopirellula sediminis TaxID=2894196 RepID=A0A9X1MK47_9BACT|nr:hypothetical protein [Blastopirellula sediminis]MCC9604409.1 hypothetical protein [Blastopirellula sediminis]MCC9626929.1 hypothetical protein [Blastopirellula sediminis]